LKYFGNTLIIDDDYVQATTFSFEGKNISDKNEFIENNKVVFEKYLDEDQKAACMSRLGNRLSTGRH